jgi:putative nucleotidyltransferase with HDIG domain
VVSDDLLRALDDDGGALRMRALPPQVRNLLTELDVPPRLAAHLRAVHDVAGQILAWVRRRFPTIDIDAPTVLTAAALHDIGKVQHTEELSGPGTAHEQDGYRLLRAHGVDERVARIVRDHGSWPTDAPLELLMVCLADKAWKDKRHDDLERQVVDQISKATGEARWTVFAELDDHLTAIGPRAVERLAYQNRHRIR